MEKEILKLNKSVNRTFFFCGLAIGYLVCKVSNLTTEVEELKKGLRDIDHDLDDLLESLEEEEEEDEQS